MVHVVCLHNRDNTCENTHGKVQFGDKELFLSTIRRLLELKCTSVIQFPTAFLSHYQHGPRKVTVHSCIPSYDGLPFRAHGTWDTFWH